MSVTAPTRPTLVSIDTTEPLRFQQRGQGHDGIDWIVQPEDIEKAIAVVNAYGGPNAWCITKVEAGS